MAMVGAFYYANLARERANEGVTERDHVKGNPTGEVELIEYSDFQCPACKQFVPYVEAVVEEHGAHLRFEYRHFPLTTIHQNATAAAIAAEAAGQQDAFFEMHDMLFERQEEWSSSPNPRAQFREYARELGLDEATFTRHLDSSLLREAVEADFREARSRGYASTPTFVLNGEQMSYTSFTEFQDQIDAAVAEVTGTSTVATTTPVATGTNTVIPERR